MQINYPKILKIMKNPRLIGYLPRLIDVGARLISHPPRLTV
jgi:hypothetical protein